MSFTLHNYFRSSTSIRVRIALALKGLAYDYQGYALLKDEQNSAKYKNINPQGLVPTLETPDGVISQSLAILEYLDETHPHPALLPATPAAKARVRSLAQIIALDIHPINNLRVLKYLRTNFNADDDEVKAWFQQWATSGFDALETRLVSESETGRYCHGDTITIADICLVSQSINNRRFDVQLQPYPTINRIVDLCLATPEFAQALPDNQPDAV